MKEESKRDKVALAMSPTLDTMWSFDPNSNKSNKSEKRVLFDDEVDFKPELKMESTAERSKSGKKRKGCDIDGEVIDMTGGGFEHGRKKKKKKKKKQRKRHLDETEEQYLFGGFAGTGYKSTFIEAALPIENGGNDSDQFNYEAEDEAQNSEEVQQGKSVISTSSTKKKTDMMSKKDKNCESSDEAKEEEKYEKKKQHSKDTNVPGSNSQVTIPPITHKETPIPLPKLLSTGSALKPAIKKKSSFTEALAAAKQRMISPSPPWVGPNVKDRESPNSEMLKNKVYEPLTESESSLAGLTATQISRNSGSTTPAVRKVTPIPPPKLLYLQKKSILPGAAAASDRPSTLSNEPVAFATPPPPATAPKAISRIDNNGSHNIASTVSPATVSGKSSHSHLSLQYNIPSQYRLANRPITVTNPPNQIRRMGNL